MGQGGRWTLGVVLVTRGEGEALPSQRGTVGLPVIVCRMARPKRHNFSAPDVGRVRKGNGKIGISRARSPA